MAKKNRPQKALVPASPEPRALRAVGFSADEVRALGPAAAELAAIVALASQVHGKDGAAWFMRPEPNLGNVLPVSLLRDPHNGPNLVKQVLLNALRGTIA